MTILNKLFCLHLVFDLFSIIFPHTRKRANLKYLRTVISLLGYKGKQLRLGQARGPESPGMLRVANPSLSLAPLGAPAASRGEGRLLGPLQKLWGQFCLRKSALYWGRWDAPPTPRAFPGPPESARGRRWAGGAAVRGHGGPWGAVRGREGPWGAMRGRGGAVRGHGGPWGNGRGRERPGGAVRGRGEAAAAPPSTDTDSIDCRHREAARTPLCCTQGSASKWLTVIDWEDLTTAVTGRDRSWAELLLLPQFNLALILVSCAVPSTYSRDLF